MNAQRFVEKLNRGKVSFFMKSMIFHNMQEITKKQPQLTAKTYLYYEELKAAGMTEEQYENLLKKEQVSVICYFSDEKKDLNTVLKQAEALREIYTQIPIRIAALSEMNETKSVPLRYRWINGIEIMTFSKEHIGEMLDWLTRDTGVYLSTSVLRLENFYSKKFTYENFLQNMKWESKFFTENLYLGGFFRGLLVSNELYHSVMSEYDFIEFMLSVMHYYYKAKCGEKMPEEQKILEYKEHAAEILRLSKDIPEGKNLWQEKIHINIDLSMLSDKIKKYYGISVVGEDYNFLGLADVLQKIRNRTRGHGVIVGKSGMALWEILFLYILILAHLFHMQEFLIEVRGEEVYAGYKGEELSCLSPFIIGQNEVPCVLHQRKRKKGSEYINYFYGEYTIPDIG